MEARERVDFQPLPGSDALKIAQYFTPNRPLPFRAMRRYYQEGGHRLSLENPTYDHYLRMHKVVVGEAGASELRQIAQELETEELPTYLDAAGWAYAEAGLASRTVSTVDRVALVEHAERAWSRSLVNTLAISETYGREYRYDDNEGHRTALNLAFAPLMKSIIVGNVRPNVMRQTFLDTAEIAHDSRLSLERAYEQQDADAAAFHRGFLFEVSALMAILHMEDPRYVPLPATARGDSGYYHRDQTHDIAIVNQHWGDIKKVIPVEIKSKASRKDKNRYKALIIPGKLRLSVGSVNSSDTVDAFYHLAHSTASTEQLIAIEQLSAQLREMLSLYQRGVSFESLAMHSLTRFHDSQTVAKQYPELY
ncbi:MAG TPA: hypothetical protein VN081_01540 [Dongiaceae bacterium]|nr:hypothetical protein [Dongiaceae bacterium]